MRDSAAVVQIDPSGNVTVHTEVSPHGQGTETTFAQIAADELGLTPDQIQIRHGNSDIPEKGHGHLRQPWPLSGRLRHAPRHPRHQGKAGRHSRPHPRVRPRRPCFRGRESD